MKNINRYKNETLSEIRDILEMNNFRVDITNGQMNVYCIFSSIEEDFEEGIVVIPDCHMEEFQERQESLLEAR